MSKWHQSKDKSNLPRIRRGVLVLSIDEGPHSIPTSDSGRVSKANHSLCLRERASYFGYCDRRIDTCPPLSGFLAEKSVKNRAQHSVGRRISVVIHKVQRACFAPFTNDLPRVEGF